MCKPVIQALKLSDIGPIAYCFSPSYHLEMKQQRAKQMGQEHQVLGRSEQWSLYQLKEGNGNYSAAHSRATVS